MTPRGVADVGGLEDRPQLALEPPQHGRVAVGALVVQPLPGRRGAGRGRRGRRGLALSRLADASAYLTKSTREHTAVMGTRRGCSIQVRLSRDRRTVVIRCTANGPGVVAAVVVRRQPAALDADRVDDPFAAACRGCRRTRSAPSSPASIASRSAASEPLGVSASAGAGRPGRRRPVAGPDRGHHLGDVRALPRRRGRPAAPRSRGVRARSRSGRATRTVPSAASTTGAAPSSRSRGSSTSSGVVVDQHGRGDPAQPERARLRVVQQLAQRGLVVGAQERLGVPDPDRAERAGGVVDEVASAAAGPASRDTESSELVDLDRRPADVERAADRPGREAVDRRPAARLDVGDQLQLAGERRTRADPARRR